VEPRVIPGFGVLAVQLVTWWGGLIRGPENKRARFQLRHWITIRQKRNFNRSVRNVKRPRLTSSVGAYTHKALPGFGRRPRLPLLRRLVPGYPPRVSFDPSYTM